MKDKKPKPPNIEFSDRFEEDLTDAPDEIKAAFRDTLDLFVYGPNHPTLRNHALRGEYAGYRSIDITVDWRVLFKEVRSEKSIMYVFHRIGTHEALYG